VEGLVSALVFLGQKVGYSRAVMVGWEHYSVVMRCVTCEKMTHQSMR